MTLLAGPGPAVARTAAAGRNGLPRAVLGGGREDCVAPVCGIRVHRVLTFWPGGPGLGAGGPARSWVWLVQALRTLGVARARWVPAAWRGPSGVLLVPAGALQKPDKLHLSGPPVADDHVVTGLQVSVEELVRGDRAVSEISLGQLRALLEQPEIVLG